MLTKKTYLEHNISEHSAFCNIFPESEKHPVVNPPSPLNSGAEVLFLLRP